MTPDQWVPWVISGSVPILALIGIVFGRLIKPPVTIKDLWEENRKLRDEFDEDKEGRKHEHTVREALVRWLQKIAREWTGEGDFPLPDEADQIILDMTIPRVRIHRRPAK